MDSMEAGLQDIDKCIDQKLDVIREQFFLLGQKLYDAKAELPVGKKFLEECVAYESRKNEAEEKYRLVAKLCDEYDEKCNEAEKARYDLDSLYSKEREIKIRLGAIIYERSALGILEKDKFPLSYADVDRDIENHKKLEGRNPIDRISAQNAIQKFQKNANEHYISYSDSAIEEDVLDFIGGNNAPLAIEELRALLVKKEELQTQLDDLGFFLEIHRIEVNKLKKGELEEIESYEKEMQNSFRESLICYGNYLFDRGGVWIGEDTSSDVLDIIEEILKLQNEYSDLNKEKQMLQKKAKAEDYRSLIENEEAKILILEREKEKLDEEIEQIRSEIKRLNLLIDRL